MGPPLAPTSGMHAVLALTSLPSKWRERIGPTVAAVILGVISAAVIAAPLIAPHDPLFMNVANRLQGSSASHLIGTDAYGRDMLSRIMVGGRLSLLIGVSAAVISVCAGLAIGLVAGFSIRRSVFSESFLFRSHRLTLCSKFAVYLEVP